MRPYNKNKLQFRYQQCVFLGYSSNHKGYICTLAPNGKVYISKHVIFDELLFPFQLNSNMHHHEPASVSADELSFLHDTSITHDFSEDLSPSTIMLLSLYY